MPKLILIRHCKSSWDATVPSDHERPLNGRGRSDAPKIGRWLKAKGHVPEHVMCSDAQRTQETLQLLIGTLDTAPRVSLEPTLYLAPPLTILRHVQKATMPTLAVVAHNPGIAEFAERMVQSPAPHPRFHDYPTGATAVIAFDHVSWQDIRPGTGRIVDFVIPADLED